MANFNLNKVIIGGRLTADIETKVTQSGIAVASFTVAVNRKAAKDKEQQADFFNVTAWRGTAEFVAKYFRKGSSICVVGTLQNRSWTDKNGEKRYATDIVADEVNFVDGKRDAGQAPSPAEPPIYIPGAYAYQTPAAPKFEEIGLPF